MSKKKNIHDLIKDQSFLNWVNQTNKKDVAKWEAWKKANPEQSELLEEARMMVNGFKFKKAQITDNQVNKSWESFASKLNQAPHKEVKVIPFRRKLLKIAALILVLFASIWGIQNFISQPKLIVFETSQNETQTFKLPDGSSVILNTNSKLSFYDNDIRKINLEGEAYFEVQKQPKGKVFQVQNENLTVEVIGTEFNFNGKREEPIVSLTEGKVNLIKPDFDEKTLEEGQTAQFNKVTETFEIEDGKTAYWKAWTLKKWAFGESTPMSEVLKRIEDTFDFRIEVTDESVLVKNASGEVSIESQEVLFEALSFLLDLELSVKNNELIISPSQK